jgi:hypothetical protein
MRRPGGRTPLPKWTAATHVILVSVARSIQIDLDRFGHRNRSARWRCPKTGDRGGVFHGFRGLGHSEARHGSQDGLLP